MSGRQNLTNRLDDFHLQIKDCVKCPLGYSRTHLVFGSGNPQAKLMCIGEAPGAEEDKQGLPFVGRAGKVLTQLLAAIGFTREEVYIANMVKCRPPQNRAPKLEETAACRPYLQHQIELIRPRYLLCLGRVAAQNLLGISAPLNQLRGQRYDLNGSEVFVTFHPAALLYNPQWKKACLSDLRRLRRHYDQEMKDKLSRRRNEQ